MKASGSPDVLTAVAVSADGVRRAVAAFADTATFATLAAAVIAVPITFSIADEDVFARPKMVLTIGLASTVAMLLVVRWLAMRRPALPPARRPLALALAVFVGWNVLAVGFAVDPAHALAGEPFQYQGLLAFVAYAILFIGAWTTVRTARRRRTLFTALVASAAVVAGYAVLQRIGLDPIWSTLHEGRVFSTVGQPNALAAYLVLVLPIVAALGLGRGLRTQLALAAVAILLLGAIALTLSRGAFLGAAVAGTVLVVALLPHRRAVVNRRLVGVAATAMLAVAAGALGVPDLRSAAGSAVGRIVDPGRVERASTNAHLDQWAVGAAIVVDRPLLGAGPDSYVLVFHEYRDDVRPPERAEIWARYRPESSHNVYLAVAGGAGVVALAAYLTVIGLVARGLVDAAGRAKLGTAIAASVVIAGVAGNLVTDFFMTAETSESTVMWILLGIGAALSPAPSGGPT